MMERRDYDRELVRLYALAQIKDMTEKNRSDILIKIEKFEEEKYQCKDIFRQDEFDERQAILAENSGLNDIFCAMWNCASAWAKDGELDIRAYVKIHCLISKALGSYDSDQSVMVDRGALAFTHYHDMYGKIDKSSFIDIMFKTIEHHTEFIDPDYYAAFAWTVLDAVSDLKKNPPRFRTVNKISTIMKLDNEAKMLGTFYKNQDAVVQLKVSNEFLERVPQIQQQTLATRRTGETMSQNDLEMLQVVARRVALDKAKERVRLQGSDSE